MTEAQILEIRTAIQDRAFHTWVRSGEHGGILAGTGFGKSRVGCLAIRYVIDRARAQNDLQDDDILVVVPTAGLRDETWPGELAKFGLADEMQYIKRLCFASLRKEKEKLMSERKGRPYKLVVFDEFHHITNLNAEPFKTPDEEEALTQFASEHITEAVMALTATAPDREYEIDKYVIMMQICPPIFTYTLDQGVADGIIADYEIRVVLNDLEASKKTVEAGSKKKPFMQTELKAYEYIEKQIVINRINQDECDDVEQLKKLESYGFLLQNNRDRFLRDLASKEELATRCIYLMRKKDIRCLIFGNGIAQIERLVPPEFCYHSKKKDDSAITLFNNLESDILGLVNAGNEGRNFKDVDQALMMRADGNSRTLTQRIGRALRIREGHRAIIYILVSRDTAEERWLRAALKHFSTERVKYFNGKSVPPIPSSN